MRILSRWFANRSLHLPNTWVSGRTNMIGNRARSRLSDANHLALNICELVKSIEFRGMWREVVTWGHFNVVLQLNCFLRVYSIVEQIFILSFLSFHFFLSFHVFLSFFLCSFTGKGSQYFHILFFCVLIYFYVILYILERGGFEGWMDRWVNRSFLLHSC